MLTKTKKWLTIFVIALTALFLVACGGNTKKEEVNPTAIQITFDFYEIENGVEIGGEDVLLNVETTPGNAIKTVTWTSSDSKIATVDENGKVKGVKPGKVTIKATSTVDESVYDEIELTVYENKDPNVVLFNARDEIKDKWVTFIAADTQLPKPTNPDVKVEYYDIDGFKITNNVYRYNYVRDTLEVITVKLNYMNTKLEFLMDVKVVGDLEHNEFASIDATVEYLKTEFNKHVKVTENIALPVTFEHDGRTLTISYTSNAEEIISKTGVYNRPSDDTPVQIEAYIICDQLSGTYLHTFTANGYSKAEKIEYIKTNVIDKLNTSLQGANLLLPSSEKKFFSMITWTSTDNNVINGLGKINPNLTEVKKATLTAHIKYMGTTSPAHAFEDDSLTIEVTVTPMVNDAQVAAYNFGEALESNDFPFYFPWGVADREGGNVLPLPVKYGGDDANLKDLAITWTCAEAGLFSPTWELQKQYLRYHPVVFTYSLTYGGNTATGEVLVNVGIGKNENIVYVAGRFAQKDEGAFPPNQPYDYISTFSKDDNDGTATTKKFAGYTFYYDEFDKLGNLSKRYQYFGIAAYTHVVDADTEVDENGIIQEKVLSLTGLAHPNYQMLLIINKTDKDIKIPITYLNYKGSTVKKDMNDNTMIRQCAVAYDGWRIGFAANKDGKVTFGTGNVSIEETFDKLIVDDAQFVYPEYITIPAGGFGWSPFTTQNAAILGNYFCIVDHQLVLEQYAPLYKD